MKFKPTNRFKKDYSKLETDIQEKVDEKLKIFAENRSHPSLRDHGIKSTKDLREFWVDTNYRVVYRIEGEYYELLRVDKHRVIDRF